MILNNLPEHVKYSANILTSIPYYFNFSKLRPAFFNNFRDPLLIVSFSSSNMKLNYQVEMPSGIYPFSSAKLIPI